MTESINQIMNRHLEQLKREVSAYKTESDLWIRTGELPNSAGNLCLHLCGNLQHYIGAVLGGSGYIRKRDEEFSRQDVPVSEMIAEIDKTMAVVNDTLTNLDKSRLAENYPEEVLGKPMTIEYFLIHLTSHLGYHLGQINYHRRLLSV
jgi:uncharacterized damage-inducible protein DinB